MAFFHVIIPAAGAGSRMAESAKSVLPKQYMLLAGKPIISHTIQTFFNHPRIASIHVALSPDDLFWRDLPLDPASKLKLHYTGGESRSETVLNTLMSIDVADDDWILVHDAARPGLTHALQANIHAASSPASSNQLATDVSEAIEALGLQPTLVPGELRNLKITYPQDLVLLEAVFKQEEI